MAQAISADHDQTVLSDLDLHCLLKVEVYKVHHKLILY